MRIIIAGGSGLIGRVLTSALINDGDQVTILSRHPGSVSGMPAGVRVLRWDGKTLNEWCTEIENTDAVINLVGENLFGDGFIPTRWTATRKKRLVQSRVESGKILSSAIEKAVHKPGVFIQSSGVGFYGIHQDRPFVEDDPAGNDFLANLCKEWEASTISIEKLGVRRVIIRSGVVFTTKGSAFRLLVLPYQLFVGGRIGTGMQVYSWIHHTDEVNAIRYLIHNDQAKGVFNLCSPYPVTNDEFGRMVANVIKRPHYFTIPAFILKIALGEVASMVLDGQRVLPNKLLLQGYVFNFPKLEQALTDLLIESKKIT
jgi:uncharacterized protein (TIGR01777 family)